MDRTEMLRLVRPANATELLFSTSSYRVEGLVWATSSDKTSSPVVRFVKNSDGPEGWSVSADFTPQDVEDLVTVVQRTLEWFDWAKGDAGDPEPVYPPASLFEKLDPNR